MILFPTVDEDYQYFVSQGYSGSINDMHYQALGVLGYTGSYTDRVCMLTSLKHTVVTIRLCMTCVVVCLPLHCCRMLLEGLNHS